MDLHRWKLVICLIVFTQVVISTTSPPVPELIRARGYPVEVHVVVTQDGYVLQLHRIPGSGSPVLLQHGLVDSSAGWIVNPHAALGYMLADANYDVWMGNYRGNRYSRNHISINPDDPAFWNFTMDSLALFDTPAMVDYVLDATKHSSLFYVGHALSTSVFWSAVNLQPRLNEQVRLMVALGPFITLKYWTDIPGISTIIRTAASHLGSTVPVYEVGSYSEWMSNGVGFLCRYAAPLCTAALVFMAGFNLEQTPQSGLSDVFSQVPAGTSYKLIQQFSQYLDTGRLQMFDHGPSSNLVAYGQPTPPQYYPEAVTAPVLLLWGQDDVMVDKKNFISMASRFPNLVPSRPISDPKWHHLDFLWARDAGYLVYEPIICYLRQFDALTGRSYGIIDTSAVKTCL